MPFKWNFAASERTIVGILWESHIKWKKTKQETCFAGNPKHTNGIQMERASLSIITQVSIWSWPIAPCVHHKRGTKLDRSHNDQQIHLHDNYVTWFFFYLKLWAYIWWDRLGTVKQRQYIDNMPLYLFCLHWLHAKTVPPVYSNSYTNEPVCELINQMYQRQSQ